MLNNVAKTKELSESEWRTLCLEWECSKLAQKQFCIERGINYSLFICWRSKLLAERGDSRTQKFKAIKVIAPTTVSSSCAPLLLKLSNGIALYISESTSKSTLSMTLELLGIKPC